MDVNKFCMLTASTYHSSDRKHVLNQSSVAILIVFVKEFWEGLDYLYGYGNSASTMMSLIFVSL